MLLWCCLCWSLDILFDKQHADVPYDVIQLCACQCWLVVSMSVWMCGAVMQLGCELVRWWGRQYDLPSLLKDFFCLCQTCCCLMVTSSSRSVAGAAPVWTIAQSLCRQHKSPFVRESNKGWVGCGAVEQLYLLCSCLQLYPLGLFVCFFSQLGAWRQNLWSAKSGSTTKTWDGRFTHVGSGCIWNEK